MSVSPIPTPRNVHPVIRAWITYLLSPDFTNLVTAALHSGTPLEIHLYTARGRIRKQPLIIIGGGPQEMTEVAP